MYTYYEENRSGDDGRKDDSVDVTKKHFSKEETYNYEQTVGRMEWNSSCLEILNLADLNPRSSVYVILQ